MLPNVNSGDGTQPTPYTATAKRWRLERRAHALACRLHTEVRLCPRRESTDLGLLASPAGAAPRRGTVAAYRVRLDTSFILSDSSVPPHSCNRILEAMGNVGGEQSTSSARRQQRTDGPSYAAVAGKFQRRSPLPDLAGRARAANELLESGVAQSMDDAARKAGNVDGAQLGRWRRDNPDCIRTIDRSVKRFTFDGKH